MRIFKRKSDALDERLKEFNAAAEDLRDNWLNAVMTIDTSNGPIQFVPLFLTDQWRLRTGEEMSLKFITPDFLSDKLLVAIISEIKQ